MAREYQLACAHVLSAGAAHVKIVSHFSNIVKSCMLPHTAFSVKMIIIDDGTEDSVTVSYSSAISMLHSSMPCETRRIRARAGEASAVYRMAFEAGRIRATKPRDRVIIFSDVSALRSELEPMGVVFVSPGLFLAHEKWWIDRENSLMVIASTVSQALFPVDETQEPALAASDATEHEAVAKPAVPPEHEAVVKPAVPPEPEAVVKPATPTEPVTVTVAKEHAEATEASAYKEPALVTIPALKTHVEIKTEPGGESPETPRDSNRGKVKLPDLIHFDEEGQLS